MYIKYATVAQGSKNGEGANFAPNARFLSSHAFREVEWFIFSTASQSVISRLTLSASPGNLLKKYKFFGPISALPNQKCWGWEKKFVF